MNECYNYYITQTLITIQREYVQHSFMPLVSYIPGLICKHTQNNRALA